MTTPEDMPAVPDGARVRVLYAESPLAGPPADIEAATGGVINLNVFHTGLILEVLGSDGDSVDAHYTVDYYATKGVGPAVLPAIVIASREMPSDAPTPSERSAAGSSASAVIAQLVSSASSAASLAAEAAADAAEKAEAAVNDLSEAGALAGALASSVVDELRSKLEAALLDDDDDEVELAAWENDAGVYVAAAFDRAYWKQTRPVATLTKEQYDAWADWIATNYVPNHPVYQLFNVYASFPLASAAAAEDAASPDVPHPLVASSTCNDFVWESLALFRAHGVTGLDTLDPPLRKDMVVLVTGQQQPEGAGDAALEPIDIEDPATYQAVARFYHGLANVLKLPHTIESVRSALSLLQHALDRVAYVCEGPPGQQKYYRVRLDRVDTIPIKLGYYPLPLTSRIHKDSF